MSEQKSLSLWHKDCVQCHDIILSVFNLVHFILYNLNHYFIAKNCRKRYENEGDKYLARRFHDAYDKGRSRFMASITKMAREKILFHGSPAVVPYPYERQRMVIYLNWMKEQLKKQELLLSAMDILGCVEEQQRPDRIPMIPVKRSKIPYITNLVSELIDDHKMFKEAFESIFEAHQAFVLEQTRNVLKKMSTVARAVGQEGPADVIANLFFDIDGPSKQEIADGYTIEVNDHQNVAGLSLEQWKVLTPLAYFIAHNSPGVPEPEYDEE